MPSRDGKKAYSGLRRRSPKRQKLMEQHRIPLIKELIQGGVGCEIGPVLAFHGERDARYCSGRLEGLHELRKRSSGGSLVNKDNLVPACNFCNGWVENNPLKAWEYGLVVRPGDPGYDELGASGDEHE